MTIDTRAMRESARLRGYKVLPGREIVALCDALDAAEARARMLTGQIAVISEAIRCENETLNDLFDADQWIGYATAIQSSNRLLAALAAVDGEEGKR